MSLWRTANPTLNAGTFTGAQVSGEEAMTLRGTVNKSMVLLALLVLASCWTWSQVTATPQLLRNTLWVSIAGLVFGFVTVFKKSWAPVTAPVYAVLEGVVIGSVSFIMEHQYPGIVIQAVALTFGTLFALLVLYSSRIIPVTENFKLGVVAATGGIAILYLIDMALMFFGHRVPMIHESGTLGICFSLFVVVIAALNLVLDFDFIEKGSQTNQPKYMEWYAGFGLIVTLVWLYFEILRLLAKTRRRR